MERLTDYTGVVAYRGYYALMYKGHVFMTLWDVPPDDYITVFTVEFLTQGADFEIHSFVGHDAIAVIEDALSSCDHVAVVQASIRSLME